MNFAMFHSWTLGTMIDGRVGLNSGVPPDTISAHPIPGSLPEILPPSDKRFCALQLRNENARPQLSRTIGIAKSSGDLTEQARANKSAREISEVLNNTDSNPAGDAN